MEECHSAAESLSWWDRITPPAVQGANNYIVRAGENLAVQFCSKLVDLAIHGFALIIHRKYIPYQKTRQLFGVLLCVGNATGILDWYG